MSLSPKLRVKRTEPSELVVEFTKIYCDLIPNLYNVQCSKFLDDVKCALKDIRRLKYDINVRHGSEFYVDLKYEEPFVRCAYMYAYNVLNTAIVYYEFSKHLKNNEEIIPNLFLRKTLKICCLAGGPGTEAVGVSKAIIDVIRKSAFKADAFTDVQVTVVDIVSEWEGEGKALFSALNKSSKLFGSKSVHFEYSFLTADLVCPIDEMLKAKIAESDIITVVKFGSSIEEKSAIVCVSYLENMIKNVIDCMQARSSLFMLDVAGGKIFRHTMDIVSKQPNKYTMNLSLHKKYRLLPKTLQKMETCINFRNVAESATLFPTVLTTVSSCFWIKSRNKSKKKTSINNNTESDKKYC